MAVGRVLLLIVAIGVAIWFGTNEEQPLPKIGDGWWGRGPEKPDSDTRIRNFNIEVGDSVLKDLKERLQNSRYGEDLEGTAFEYGFNTQAMRQVVAHWINLYDWRKHEDILNSFNHFKTNIEGIDVHFIHVKSKSPKAKPLLMIHGWPGSVWEFHKVIPMLTDPVKYGGVEEDAFDVICPSIPGYGWSEAPHQQGFSKIAAANLFVKLMKRLGHDMFYVQGGDWGAWIANTIAQAFPEKLYGIHVNMITPSMDDSMNFARQLIGAFFPSLVYNERETEKLYPFSENFFRLLRETGYAHIQATKPDTVAMALQDSPRGLAAYILEKFSVWTNAEYAHRVDGGLTQKFTLDELLTNVMIYWTTNSIGSSMRFYKEEMKNLEWDRVPIYVPAGLASFPEEIAMTPRSFVTKRYTDIVQFSEMPRGGHFAAFEEPQLFVEDVRSFRKKVELRGEAKP